MQQTTYFRLPMPGFPAFVAARGVARPARARAGAGRSAGRGPPRRRCGGRECSSSPSSRRSAPARGGRRVAADRRDPESRSTTSAATRCRSRRDAPGRVRSLGRHDGGRLSWDAVCRRAGRQGRRRADMRPAAARLRRVGGAARRSCVDSSYVDLPPKGTWAYRVGLYVRFVDRPGRGGVKRRRHRRAAQRPGDGHRSLSEQRAGSRSWRRPARGWPWRSPPRP